MTGRYNNLPEDYVVRGRALQLAGTPIELDRAWKDRLEVMREHISLRHPRHILTPLMTPIEAEDMLELEDPLLREIGDRLTHRYGQVLPCMLEIYGQPTLLLPQYLLDWEWLLSWYDGQNVLELIRKIEEEDINHDNWAWREMEKRLLDNGNIPEREYKVQISLTGRSPQDLFEDLLQQARQLLHINIDQPDESGLSEELKLNALDITLRKDRCKQP